MNIVRKIIEKLLDLMMGMGDIDYMKGEEYSVKNI